MESSGRRADVVLRITNPSEIVRENCFCACAPPKVGGIFFGSDVTASISKFDALSARAENGCETIVFAPVVKCLMVVYSESPIRFRIDAKNENSQ